MESAAAFAQQHHICNSNNSMLAPPPHRPPFRHHNQTLPITKTKVFLPQCKINRNYSCSYWTYFTQNPRCHLQHLRDIHREKININKCQLCFNASRHFQKLVRHMKMVHGCSGHGQTCGMSKHKLLLSVGVGVTEIPTLEQVSQRIEYLDIFKKKT